MSISNVAGVPQRSGIFREIVGLLVVDIVLIEAGVEKRRVAEETGRNRHQRLFASEP